MKRCVLFLISFVGIFPINAAAQTHRCGFPSSQLLQGPLREFRNQYRNRGYGYAVTIPKGYVGFDPANPFYQRGFWIALGQGKDSYIDVYGEKNSFEDVSTNEVANRHLSDLRGAVKAVESSSVTPISIGGRPASQLLITYTCPGSPERYIQLSIFGLSPNKDNLYVVTLYSVPREYDLYRTIVDQILKSWKYLDR